MLRVERSPGALTLVSRFARPRAVAALAAAFLAGAAALARPAPALAAALALVGLLLALLAGRSVRARFEPGRVSVRDALGRRERPLADFASAVVETAGEARRRRAERRARGWAERAGGELPSWLRAPDAPGTHDHLRRVVLLARRGEDLAVTAWVADGDVEAVRAEVDGLLR